ncbi:MAG: LysR substrate-binding domain-containing protein [Acidihalobacter sp.]
MELFMRKGRGLVITPSGEIFLEYVCKILAFCEEARRALEPSSEPSGVLRIGAIETAATGRLPAVLSKFHQDYPAVQMQFSTGTWQQLVSDVADHKLDGAIVATKSDHPDISYLNIRRPPATIDRVLRPGCPYRRALERWLYEHKIPADITSIASYGTILGCVTAGAGVSLVPSRIFEQFKMIGDIRGYEFNELLPVQNYFIKNNAMGVHRAREAFETLLFNELGKI